ncbi:MAG TPA: hypothetical protein VEC08_02015 [Nitrososphaerales archaeon]|nr:hypothetical protein [Nitrososphaerales archaeon]
MQTRRVAETLIIVEVNIPEQNHEFWPLTPNLTAFEVKMGALIKLKPKHRRVSVLENA